MADAQPSAKRCSACNIGKSEDRFYQSKGRLASCCKDCHSARYSKAAGYESPRKRKAREEAAERRAARLAKPYWCKACKVEHPRSAFPPGSIGGRHPNRCTESLSREGNPNAKGLRASKAVDPSTLADRPCTRCCVTKPVSQFRRISSKRVRCGFSYYPKCKKCERSTRRRRTAEEARAYRRQVAERQGRVFRSTIGPEAEARRALLAARRRQAVLASAARAFTGWFARLGRAEVDRERRREAYRARYQQIKHKEIARSRERKRLYRESARESGYEWTDLYSIRDSATICSYCQKPLGDERHLDHVVPLSMGGKTEPENLVASCAKCNLEKAGRDPMKWAAMRGTEMVERMTLLLMGA